MEGFRKTLLLLLLSLVLGGCQQSPVRDGMPTDMEDNTGQMGQNKRKGAGDIYVQLAVEYMREGQLAVALVKAKRALEVEPANAEAHNVIALLYERLGEPGLAERHYRQGLRYQPRNSYMLNAYGAFLCKQDRFDEAEQRFMAAVKNPLYRTPEVAWANAGVCAGRKPDAKLSERYLRRALQDNPRLPLALRHMAQVSYDKGEYLSARAYLQRYLEVASQTAGTLWLGIQVERELNNQDAVASYSLLLRNSFPDSQEYQLFMESGQR